MKSKATPLPPAIHGAALGAYPQTRLRRLRRHPWLRKLLAENRLDASDLIWPAFVVDGKGERQPIASMPGVCRLSIDLLEEAIGKASDLGILAVAIFPFTAERDKTKDAREALNPDNLVCRSVRAIKKSNPGIGVICDVALDPYNSDGHDGLFRGGEVLNDETVEILQKQAVVQARAGCDVIAPSDMMDGRVGAIRKALDENGFDQVSILSYAAKYASAFYGPFRDAVGSKSSLKGDKKTYQMNPANGDEALRETAMDLAEGADMVMVKPGLAYLDIIQRVKEAFHVPTFAYNVSGEYAMLKAAAAAGGLDYEAAMMESLLSFKRAGADAILTYSALDAARMLKEAS